MIKTKRVKTKHNIKTPGLTYLFNWVIDFTNLIFLLDFYQKNINAY